MTPSDRARGRPWTIPVAGASLAALGLTLAVTTPYAVTPASAAPLPRAVAGSWQHAVPQAVPPALPQALPQAGPTCAPWQTSTTVPPGIVLQPRVFPGD